MEITILDNAMLDNLKRVGSLQITLLSHFSTENKLRRYKLPI